MLTSPSQYLIEQVSSPDDIQTLNLIDSCYTALSEGSGDSFVVTTAISSSNKFLLELLDKIYNALMDIYIRILNYLNNYFMNSARMADKYRKLIIDRYSKLDTPILYKSHLYPSLYDKNYPNIIPTSELIDDLTSFQNKIFTNNMSSDSIKDEIEFRVSSFAVDSIGSTIDMYSLQTQVEDIVRKKIQGMETLKKLNQSDLNKLIDELNQYKDMKNAINATKKSVESEYKALKSAMMSHMREKISQVSSINDINHPDAEALKNAEYNRFANINTAVSQMYSAFISIYNIAFTTKFKCLREKIDENRTIINDLLIKTSIFAAANPNIPRAYRAPQKFDPKIS